MVQALELFQLQKLQQVEMVLSVLGTTLQDQFIPLLLVAVSRELGLNMEL